MCVEAQRAAPPAGGIAYTAVEMKRAVLSVSVWDFDTVRWRRSTLRLYSHYDSLIVNRQLSIVNSGVSCTPCLLPARYRCPVASRGIASGLLALRF